MPISTSVFNKKNFKNLLKMEIQITWDKTLVSSNPNDFNINSAIKPKSGLNIATGLNKTFKLSGILSATSWSCKCEQNWAKKSKQISKQT